MPAFVDGLGQRESWPEVSLGSGVDSQKKYNADCNQFSSIVKTVQQSTSTWVRPSVSSEFFSVLQFEAWCKGKDNERDIAKADLDALNKAIEASLKDQKENAGCLLNQLASSVKQVGNSSGRAATSQIYEADFDMAQIQQALAFSQAEADAQKRLLPYLSTPAGILAFIQIQHINGNAVVQTSGEGNNCAIRALLIPIIGAQCHPATLEAETQDIRAALMRAGLCSVGEMLTLNEVGPRLCEIIEERYSVMIQIKAFQPDEKGVGVPSYLYPEQEQENTLKINILAHGDHFEPIVTPEEKRALSRQGYRFHE